MMVCFFYINSLINVNLIIHSTILGIIRSLFLNVYTKVVMNSYVDEHVSGAHLRLATTR
jgi:hypothetical protein